MSRIKRLLEALASDKLRDRREATAELQAYLHRPNEVAILHKNALELRAGTWSSAPSTAHPSPAKRAVFSPPDALLGEPEVKAPPTVTGHIWNRLGRVALLRQPGRLGQSRAPGGLGPGKHVSPTRAWPPRRP